MGDLAPRIAEGSRAHEEPAVAPVFCTAEPALHLEVLAGPERPLPPFEGRLDIIRMKDDVRSRLRRQTRQTLEGPPRIGDPVRVDMDNPAAPVGDKNEIRRCLGYVKIPEFANLRTPCYWLVPLVLGPETKPARGRRKSSKAGNGCPMALRVRDALPSLEGATRWINGPELSAQELTGRPVFVHFWAMTCYVCHDVAGEVTRWRRMFEPAGLLFVAVHQPRVPQELDVEAAIADARSKMNITHRAAFDNDLQIVERFDNQFVPAYYLFDREHKLRHFQAGDKSYDRIEAAIERVLAEVPQTAKA